MTVVSKYLRYYITIPITQMALITLIGFQKIVKLTKQLIKTADPQIN